MAQQRGIQRDKFRCSICLDLLKDPVAIPCGHSYCMGCIKDYWDEGGEQESHSCPQCRQTFTPRPMLVKNTMLAELVEELRKTELQAAAPDDLCHAGPGDVACDVCSEAKLKALKSCLVCLASYCEHHLQPHYDAAPLRKHKLVEATVQLRENVCSRHDEVMKIFCRTDQQCICYLCSMDEHKGHDTVSAAAEWTERKKELGVTRQKIQQRIHDGERDVKVLQQEVEAINLSADKAVEDSEQIFAEVISFIEKKGSDVKQQIRSQQEAEVSRAEKLQEELEKEIAELRRKDSELEQLSHTEERSQFLHKYHSLSCVREPAASASLNIRTLTYFEVVTATVSEVRDKLQVVFSEEGSKILLTMTEVDVLLPQPEPTTRGKFLKYSCQVTLDSDTANIYLLLSKEDRKAQSMKNEQLLCSYCDRFSESRQVLSREGLNGRCYWEVKWKGQEVTVAAAYEDISRSGDDSEFGYNDKSWALNCSSGGYTFRHNNEETSLLGRVSSRVGVYLDHRAGVLSFYSVSEYMTLLHRVHTVFTQPLHPGLGFSSEGAAAELCEL